MPAKKIGPVIKGTRKLATNRRQRRRKVRLGNLKCIWMGYGFPECLYTTLTYSEKIPLGSTAGSVASYTIRGNDLYDPNYTGVGHQPYYRDELAALYNRYCVVSSKISVKFVAGTITETSNWHVLVRATSIPTAPANISLEEERQNSYSRLYNNSGNPVSLTMKKSTHRVLGMPKTEKYDDSLCSDMFDHPSEKFFYHICAQPVTGVSQTIYAYMKLELRVKCYEKNIVSQS